MALIVGIYGRLLASIGHGFRAILAVFRLDRAAITLHLRGVEWSLVVPLAAGIGSAIVVAAIAGLVIAVLAAVLNAGVTWLWSRIGQQMVYDVSRSLFGHMQRLSLRFHHRANVGDLLVIMAGMLTGFLLYFL